MGDIDIDIEVDELSVEKVEEKLENSLREGAKTTRDNLLSIGQTHARNVITRRDAVWRGQLLDSISTKKLPSNQYQISGKVYTTSDHARPVEEGAEYTDEGPNIENLIPWVKDHYSFLGGFDAQNIGPDDPDPGPELEEESFDVDLEDAEISRDKPSFDFENEDEIAGPKTKGGVQLEKDLDLNEGVFYKEGTFDDTDWADTYRSQRIIVYDDGIGEYKEATVVRYSGPAGDKPRVVYERGNIEEEVDLRETVEFDIVWAEDFGSREVKDSVEDVIDLIKNEHRKSSFNNYTDFKRALSRAVTRITDSSKSEDLDKAIVEYLSRTDYLVGDTQPRGSGSAGQHMSGTTGPKYIYLDDSKTPDDIEGTAVHELFHGIDNRNGYSSVVMPSGSKPSSKTSELKKKIKKSGTTRENFVLNFGYVSDYNGDPNAQYPYADAEKHFIQDRLSQAEKQLGHFGRYVRNEVKDGPIADSTISYESVPEDKLKDLFGPEGSITAGDRLKGRVYPAGGGGPINKELKVVSTDSTEFIRTMKVMDNSGQRYEMTYATTALDEEPDDFYIDYKGRNSDFVDIAYSEDSPERSILDFRYSDDERALYEAINRAWLRQALAEEIHQNDFDTRAEYYIKRHYSAVGAVETAAIARTMWVSGTELASNRDSTAIAGSLYQNHPDLFYALGQLYEPSQEFKEELENSLGIDYETAIDRIEP